MEKFEKISGKKRHGKFEKVSRKYLWHAGFLEIKRSASGRPNFCARLQFRFSFFRSLKYEK